MNTQNVNTQIIAQELELTLKQVEAVLVLLAEDATVPFIARYRKEATGSLDEVAIAAIRDRHEALVELEKRRTAIMASLTERNLLTPELAQAVSSAATLTALEDVYLPYRPKRRTRASMAKERGLEPLADTLMTQQSGNPEDEATAFVNTEVGVADVAAALAGARDILAERMVEQSEARERLRHVFTKDGLLKVAVVAGKEEEAAKYRDYFAWEEPTAKSPSHRLLAVLRGENEKLLRVSVRPADDDLAERLFMRLFVKKDNAFAGQVRQACADGYQRLLAPALENESRSTLKLRADNEAIAVFAANLKELLLAPPFGAKTLLAVDPGFRTGCKVVCLNPEGRLLEYVTINPHAGSDRARAEAGQTMLNLVQKYPVEVVCVGNGTAGRETETFLRALPGWPGKVPIVMVSESGASVYSASEQAREEFPDLDLTYRGAVSIGRRLVDPLAELVKIDPKAIGVGQYQHDVDQGALKRALDDVVMHCVNAVGVEVNTASEPLLAYVSGLGPTLARNIVAWRHQNGAFTSRKDLLKVPRLGPKAFEQCSGFLRIHGGKHPLDASAVHPESYPLVEQMAKDTDCTVVELLRDKSLRERVKRERYVSASVGLPTINDIMDELEKPGRDPREAFTPFAFADGVNSIDDLHEGMVLPGIVTNVTAFGAFVDVGVHQDGLVHISQLADRFVRHASEVVKVQQRVSVTVTGVDKPRRRIALSMKS